MNELTKEQIEAIEEFVNKLNLESDDETLAVKYAINKLLKSPQVLSKLNLHRKDEPKDNWIKIEEGCEMPEYFKRVLVVTNDVTGIAYLDEGSRKWYDDEDSRIPDPIKWQPLPPVN